jgi:hypothetical protein
LERPQQLPFKSLLRGKAIEEETPKQGNEERQEETEAKRGEATSKEGSEECWSGAIGGMWY